MNIERAVAEHYGRRALAEEILAAAGARQAVTTDDLAPYDEFHIGGRAATDYLLPYMAYDDGMRVLDVGCGIGGPARYIAQQTGAHITGIDLTPEFIDTAAILSARTGLQDRTMFDCGSALDMPYDDEAFDGAYMLHVGMNIADKLTLYDEIRRVMKPQGTFVLYDIFGDSSVEAFRFPVPWSSVTETSFLVQASEAEDFLRQAGFYIEYREDRCAVALSGLKKMLQIAQQNTSPVMGPTFGEKLGNLMENIRDVLCGPHIFICRKV